PSAVELEGVEVVADKSPIEYKLDKKVVNVSQVINAAGGTAVDVLENTPSVQVDIEGNVSVRGSSNFTVLIDGRPSVLSGSEALRQIPSSSIESIEIITNPSAKYEPDGTAGIINLVMKKNSMNGFNGIINASVGTRDKYRGDFKVNYRTEKFNVFAGADWRDETRFGDMLIRRQTFRDDTTAFLNINGQRNYVRSGHSFKSGVDFYLTDMTTLTVAGEVGKSKSERNGRDGETHSYTIPASKEFHSVTEEFSIRTNDFYSGTMNFQHKFNDDEHRLEAYVFYSYEEGDEEETEAEILADSDYNATGEYIDRVSSLETEEEKEFEFKLDYTWPFSEDGRLEAGMQNRLESEIEGMIFRDYDAVSDSWVVNDFFSSTTDFRRDIHALYTTYANKLGGLEYMVGLRGELTIREIANTNAEEPSSLNRFDFFPTLHLSYPIKEKTELMASYSRRINRPGGRALDPIPSYYNRYTIRLGNPDLEPEYTNSYELGAMQRFGEGRSYLSLDAFHRVTNNKIDGTQTLGDDGVFYLRTDNFDNDYATGLEVTANVNFAEWLMLNASTSAYHYKITGILDDELFTRESTNWNGRANTTFKFSDNSRMQITAYYRGPSVSPQGESGSMFFSDVSYRHEFFNRKLSATLSVRDPLGTAQFERTSYGDNFESYFKFSREPRVVMLTLSYKIRNFKDENGRRNGGGDMDMGGGEF
ncbi:MAG: TonB-dependent receptor domain-containing protein, partial [Prolixibacteraceae bacterium]